jgi:hypothetical protein
MPRVFVHSPSETPDAVVMAGQIPEFEMYGERALLLAGPGDIVCLARAVDARYLDFLRSLDLGPRPEDVLVIEGVVPGGGISARVIEDPGSLERLVARLAGAGPVELHPFFAAPATFTLGRMLRTRLGRAVRVVGGPPPLVRRVHDKLFTRDLARALDVPVAPGDVVRIAAGEAGARELPELRRAVESRARLTGRVVVRGISGASGSSTFTLGPDGIDGLVEAVSLRTDNTRYLVEPLLESTVSPNIEVVVGRGGSSAPRVGATDQILDADLVYRGSAHPSQAARLDAMIADALRIADWMGRRGFTGRIGFDFVEHDAGGAGGADYFLAEINPRINGATYPLALTARLAGLARRLGAPRPTAFRTMNLPAQARDYAALERDCGSLLYDPGPGEGVVPYTTGTLPLGKVGAACLAGSPARAAELLAELVLRAGPRDAAARVTAP